jgi:hypothetical protein
MPSPLDFPARGRILRIENDRVVFNPSGTAYELHLVAAGPDLPAPSAYTISACIRATARKVWTMPGGGNFVTPIFGPPKVVQGMVRYLEERLAIVQAGVPILLALPAADVDFDLSSGPVVPGGIINATTFPGATIQVARMPAPAAST